MKNNKISRFIEICLGLIAITDEKGQEAPFLEDLGLGCRAFSGYMRAGITEVILLQENYVRALDNAEYHKTGEEEARGFLEDIFGERDIDSICDENKEKLKAFVKENDF